MVVEQRFVEYHEEFNRVCTLLFVFSWITLAQFSAMLGVDFREIAVCIAESLGFSLRILGTLLVNYMRMLGFTREIVISDWLNHVQGTLSFYVTSLEMRFEKNFLQ